MNKIDFYEQICPNLRTTLNSVNPHFNKDLIIRYLYRELAGFVQRDLKYFLSTDEEKVEQYKSGFVNRFPYILCATISDFYVDVFNEFGINAKRVKANSAEIPLFAVVVEGEKGNYFLNPLEDVFNNQYGLRPTAFGIVPRYKTINSQYSDLIKLSSQYLDELDQELGFEYLDEFLNKLRPYLINKVSACRFLGIPLIRNLDIRENKLEFFSKNLINLGHVNGTYERALMYRFLTEKFMDRREKNHVRVKIQDGLTPNPFISYELERVDGNILFYEKKTESGYRLQKIR